MALVRENSVALYRQIAGQLRAEIAGGAFEPTGRLPSEAGIAGRFAVSRVTVRLALDALEREELIDRRKGKGTFVAGRQVRQRMDTLRSFHQSLVMQGLDAAMRIEGLEAIDSPPDLVGSFGPRCTLLERLHLVSGEPVALGRSLLPEAISRIDRADVEGLPTYALLELLEGRSRGGIAKAEVAIGARQGDPRASALLGTPRDAVLLVMERSSHFGDDSAAERSEFFIRPERYKFVLGTLKATAP